MTDNHDLVLIYTTTPTQGEAEHIARTLVDEHLATCGNIIPHMRAIYRWQGRTEETDEVILILKTTVQRFDAIVQRIKTLHSQTVPCIVQIPITNGEANYIRWLQESVNVDHER